MATSVIAYDKDLPEIPGRCPWLPLHFQVSFAEPDLAKIITIYEPDPKEWSEHRKRR